MECSDQASSVKMNLNKNRNWWINCTNDDIQKSELQSFKKSNDVQSFVVTSGGGTVIWRENASVPGEEFVGSSGAWRLND